MTPVRSCCRGLCTGGLEACCRGPVGVAACARSGDDVPCQRGVPRPLDISVCCDAADHAGESTPFGWGCGRRANAVLTIGWRGWCIVCAGWTVGACDGSAGCGPGSRPVARSFVDGASAEPCDCGGARLSGGALCAPRRGRWFPRVAADGSRRLWPERADCCSAVTGGNLPERRV